MNSRNSRQFYLPNVSLFCKYIRVNDPILTLGRTGALEEHQDARAPIRCAARTSLGEHQDASRPYLLRCQDILGRAPGYTRPYPLCC
jgi:hypothetical protein